jgi:hypothetical protein
MIGFAQEPDFELHPEGGPTMHERIKYTMLHNKEFQKPVSENFYGNKIRSDVSSRKNNRGRRSAKHKL